MSCRCDETRHAFDREFELKAKRERLAQDYPSHYYDFNTQLRAHIVSQKIGMCTVYAGCGKRGERQRENYE